MDSSTAPPPPVYFSVYTIFSLPFRLIPLCSQPNHLPPIYDIHVSLTLFVRSPKPQAHIDRGTPMLTFTLYSISLGEPDRLLDVLVGAITCDIVVPRFLVFRCVPSLPFLPGVECNELTIQGRQPGSRCLKPLGTEKEEASGEARKTTVDNCSSGKEHFDMTGGLLDRDDTCSPLPIRLYRSSRQYGGRGGFRSGGRTAGAKRAGLMTGRLRGVGQCAHIERIPLAGTPLTVSLLSNVSVWLLSILSFVHGGKVTMLVKPGVLLRWQRSLPY